MKVPFQGLRIEPDTRDKYIICVSDNDGRLDLPLTIDKLYEHIPDDAVVGYGGVSGLRGARELYYTVLDDNGEIHNYPKRHFRNK
jgi:hypothetical protein